MVASTLGALEALIHFLGEDNQKVPISGVSIGKLYPTVTLKRLPEKVGYKKNVMQAATQLTAWPLYLRK